LYEKEPYRGKKSSRWNVIYHGMKEEQIMNCNLATFYKLILFKNYCVK